MSERFSEYDVEKMKSACKLLQEVLEYYYCFPPTKRYEKRLDTIVIKLNELIEMQEEKGRC